MARKRMYLKFVVTVLICMLYSSVSMGQDYVFVRQWPAGVLGLRGPGSVALDSFGNIYIADINNNCIQKLDSNGNFLTKWGTPYYGSNDGQFNCPCGISLDNSGNVYVVDTYNCRIQKFDSNGNFISKWGTEGSGDGQFSYPRGISLDSSGNVYVADTNNCRVQKFESNGSFINKWGTEGSDDGQFSYPRGISVDSSGNVYVADTSNSRVQKFDSDGNFLTKWGSYGSGDGQFYGPCGVSVDSSGNVYVADTNNHRIQKFDSNGNFITKWGTWGPSDGQFNLTYGVSVDSSGNVYVADTWNNRIQKFDPNGNFITKWGTEGLNDGQLNIPWKLSVDSFSNIYVADTYNNRIQKFDPNGNFITKWGSLGSGDGQFFCPGDVSIDSSGNVYVADTYNNRIQKFDSNGNFLMKWGGWGSGDSQFINPYGISVDNAGKVYVADTNNNRVQKFDSNGNFITKWGSYGSGDGQFSYLRGISVNSSGNVYVADTNNHRIQKFDSNGNFITKWGTWGPSDGQFNLTYGVSVDSSGNVYVVGHGNHRIQKFDSNGNFITKWGSYGSGVGQFFYPGSVSVNSSGNVYVADTFNHRIQVFSPNISLILTNRMTDLGCEIKNEYSGTINQDQTSSLYTFNNYKVQDLAFGLNWAGSILKLSVYKPNGSLFKEEQGTSPVIIQVPNSEIGDWHYIVVGVDVPTNNYPYVTQVGILEPSWMRIRDGLVGYWPMDEGDGDKINDISGKGNDGAANNTKWVDGKFGKALLFEGNGDVVVPSTAELNLGNKFTMMAYINTQDLSDFHQIIAKDTEYLLRIDTPTEGSRMSAFVKLNGNWEPRASSNNVPDMNTWIHIAAIYDCEKKSLKIYVNGILNYESYRDGKSTPSNNPITFGTWNGGSRFKGGIDEVAIFNVALLESDIKSIADNGLKSIIGLDTTTALKTGWNMISFPGTLSNPSVSELIPQGSNIIPPLYTYDPTTFSYKEVTEVKPGEGYWALSMADESISANVTPVTSLVLNLKAGWNMIGSVNGNVDFTNPQDNPDESVIPPIYTYNPLTFGYEEKTNIEPNKGYWVLAIQDCTLTLNSNAASPRNNTIKAYATKPDWIVPVQIITGRDIKEIALGIQSDASDSFDPYMDIAMPPKVDMLLTQPEASFLIDNSIVKRLSRDIRKNDNNVIWNIEVENTEDTELTWNVSSLPIDKDISLQFSGTEIGMRVQKSIKVPSGKHIIAITLKDRVPTKTEAFQNYPNPFNPDTWIPYQLSEAGKVVVNIYDASGSLVRRLDLGYKESGMYMSREKAVHWDGRNETGEKVSSGVYFYHIQTGKFSKVIKLVMLK